MLMGMVPFLRHGTTKEEDNLAVHIRGNEPLYEALTNLIRTRIEARSRVTEPSDPIQCKSIIARDRELQWLLDRLEFIYNMPSQQQEVQEDELPAA